MNVRAAHAQLLQEAGRRFGVDAREAVPLAGGSRNHVYRVGRPPQALVVRIAGEGDASLGVSRESELASQRAAAGEGLAPRVLWSSPGGRVIAEEWVRGRPWTREQATDPGSLRRIAQWMQRLHAVPPPRGLRRVDFLESFEHYLALVDAAKAPPALVAEARRCRAELGEPARAVLCHHDLHHANILDDGGRLTVVDWEYAGLGDSIMDLAGFAAYHALDEPASRGLVGAYGASAAIGTERLACARRLFELVAVLWGEAAALCGAIKKQS